MAPSVGPGTVSVAETLLWSAVLLVFGVGDVATTVVGIRQFGLREANPFVVRFVGTRPDVTDTVLVKLVALSLTGGAYLLATRTVGRLAALVVPLFLVGVGVRAVQVNLAMIGKARHRRRNSSSREQD